MTGPVTVRAPAKINLHLGVGAPREDGFHPLDTVYQALRLSDDVTVSAASELTTSLVAADHIDGPSVPLGTDNIVARAATLLAARLGREPQAALHIAKQIPVAGGMAGGSADAAAALRALDRLWAADLPETALLELAAELGSDVPFALVGGTARGRGRGELVEPVVDPATWSWVVVPSTTGLSTPSVYRHFDALFPDAPAEPVGAEPLLAAIASGDPAQLGCALHNDLQAPAVDLRPELGELIARGEAEGALRGLVSGSGPTCVFLCADGGAAEATAAGLRGAGHGVVLTTTGPAPGAHLIAG
ncbi:4-(cytidine 5'-diphospho)-2-C-methyl-D-erythritol kinase [Nocardioides gansuensis]|uniref:4-diphosphocytidyl-2-C-methyl-D-erythritol kinase n=1 Tax=Nocardioides gansuensis TaxID=2138300 RepID=A0A2T8F5K7_9ACTN|nr:4-(cytidine 5'-diphospho)-2-C-methyl-D-erythritol kinase [Nocardioides gansuensis]